MDLLVFMGVLAIGGTVGGLVLALRALLARGDDDDPEGRAQTFEALDPAFQRRAVAAALGRLDAR